MKRAYWILFLGSLLLSATALQAQKFTRDNYLEYMPPDGPIVTQTRASDSLHLFGDDSDPEYFEDTDPVDGIDDKRGLWLRYLAAVFAPILRKNNFSAPRDFEAMLNYKSSARLYSDVWNFVGAENRRNPALSDVVDLDLLAPGRPVTEAAAQAQDQKILQYFAQFNPGQSRIPQTRPEQQSRQVLYFDFAGEDEASWEKIYRADTASTNSRIYAHPFIHEDSTAAGAARYELVFQYWFFYPFNNGGNNHEGDWEHINVRITTRARRGDLLSAADIGRILDHRNDTIIDSLLIKKVDYYFHHYVVTLDYQQMDFLQDEKSFKAALRQIHGEASLQNWVNEQIYYRLHLVKNAINNHPLGYIGADNMGLDQILAGPGGNNRDSHGTYPFPGLWKNIGPLGAVEKINGEREYKFLFPPGFQPKVLPFGTTMNATNKYKPEKNPRWVSYTREQIELIPDWERVAPLVQNDAQARRKWFWLVLPIRWGFPLSPSPGAMLMKHTDLGNVAPVGPAYNSAWNRVGPSPGYEPYDPYVLPSQYQIDFQDNFFNSWGFFNLTYPSVVMLPGANLAWFYTFSRLRFNPKIISKHDLVAHKDLTASTVSGNLSKLPFRFGSLVYAPNYVQGNNDFARLLPQTENAGIAAFLRSHPGAGLNLQSLQHENAVAPLGFMFNLHIGRRLSTEHAFASSRSDLSYRIDNAARTELGQVTGVLRLNEVTASWRYSILAEAFQPFVRGGYGWSWHGVREVKLNGSPLSSSIPKWANQPGFWPNTTHLGVGVEYFLMRNNGITGRSLCGALFTLGKMDLGLRLSYTRHWHKLTNQATANASSAKIHRQEIGLGIVVGF